MEVTKEIISPGTYTYINPQTGLPEKLTVTPKDIQHFHTSGNQMLAAGLSVPVPLEHQPTAKPLSAAERAADMLKNNGGWVNKYELKGDTLFGVLDIPDPDIAKKLPHTIKWTSPWISSFTDGTGKKWDNVIGHLALTTRPRITKQAPFESVDAAMSLIGTLQEKPQVLATGVALSKAGLLKETKAGFEPRYPMAFSLLTGISLADAAGHEHDESGKFTAHGHTEKAHAASSKLASAKTEGSGHAHEHARQAMQASKAGNSAKAAHHHEKAAQYHRSAAKKNKGGWFSRGDKGEHEGHEAAAKHHEAAAKAHGSKGKSMSVDALLGSDELRGKNKAGQLRAINAKDPEGDYHPSQHTYKVGGGKKKRVKRKGKRLAMFSDDDVREVDDDYELDEDEEFVDEEPERRSPLDDIDNDGDANDLQIHEIISHLLKALGFSPPDGMDATTFERDILETLMAKVHEEMAKANVPEPEPLDTEGDTEPQNPIIQESPNMYASMQEINAIADPKERKLAGMLFSLSQENAKNKKLAAAAQKNILDEARKKRDQRVERITKRLPAGKRDMLLSLLGKPSAALSLSDDGKVFDPMAEALEIMEATSIDLSRSLTGATEQVQPAGDGMMSEERRKAVMEEVLRNTGGVPLRLEPAK